MSFVNLSLNQFASCPQRVVDVAVSELTTKFRSGAVLDVLSLDSWKCDALLVERLILGEHSLRPRLLDFTTASDEPLQPLVDKLSAHYQCYFMTTKPEHKRFRGIRQPQYPIAVRLDGCWRGVYDSFRNDRYHMTCVLSRDAMMSTVMTAFTRMTHRGLHAGCSLAARSSRMQRLDNFLATR
jgi:hypothetical protein